MTIRAAVLAAAVAALDGCDLAYPEVVVVNRAGPAVLIRNPSFNGCLWEAVLADGEATAPGFCLPGADRVHFRKLDVAAWCREQVEDGVLDGICLCEGVPTEPVDPALIDELPRWFAYRTVVVHQVDYGDRVIIELTLAEAEQDFDVPGPYGH